MYVLVQETIFQFGIACIFLIETGSHTTPSDQNFKDFKSFAYPNLKWAFASYVR